jgi:hypothetical protein
MLVPRIASRRSRQRSPNRIRCSSLPPGETPDGAALEEMVSSFNSMTGSASLNDSAPDKSPI